MKKLITVIGARPQFVKAAAFSSALKEKSTIEHILVHTGQHYDYQMSKIFFEQLDISKPQYSLSCGGGSHAENTSKMMVGLEEIFINEAPDAVCVFGDTDSTLAAAITAKKLCIRLIHVEAGLRSFNNNMPEEINRIVTDRVSDLLFTSSNEGVSNLIDEGIDGSKIRDYGDIMYDCYLSYRNFFTKPSIVIEDRYCLLTLHRQENTDDAKILRKRIEQVNALSRSIRVVFPVHPRTKKLIEECNIELHANVLVVDPMGYFEFGWLIEHSEFIVTDSGGLQKEAYFAGKFCFTLRNETEWVELTNRSFNVLVQTQDSIDLEHIVDIPESSSIYGVGDTSKKIADFLEENL
ncbi:UDP-N-acetylglucosamine 2-epimerase (non-hydrolyzing) [Vibrio sp. 10N.261.55.A7]|uniref:non-hydrolyzing UDP-N-acetylglucosamine 2-epimerase n=1 Tax=Vibrio sp. 10N.261.55.A7 TaxID=1880851 RepID=UPI000C83C404|nr:UDP-N-acetylglucosamine 2-epimerase (non-hydrolyzing) [Vibrio sp. 10N.261.55.A7]PMK05030.1 UDP-N-acetylglucosamine 2-epimerase [Vibrio sp. 10N.261.55.A7]